MIPVRRWLKHNLRRWLSRPGIDHAIVWIAFALLLFSLDTGLAADDYIHMMIAQGSREIAGFVRPPLDMFRFTSGDATLTLMREGVMSWWDDPEARLAFFRPLSSLTHFIDYRLWPEAAWAMHLHSALWSLCLLFAVLLLFRRLISPPWVCALAVALYALDDGRAWFVSWIAARNAVVATALSVWALYFHVRGRSDDKTGLVALAAALYLASLLAGEGALSICAYLFAYALFVDQGSPRARVASLAPYFVLTVAWRVVYTALGYGVQGSGLYFEPVGEPLSYLTGLLERAPVLLFSQIGGAWSDGYTGMYPYPTLMRAFWIVAVLSVGLFVYALWPMWRRDRLFRFGAAGALLAVLPASAVFSADRMLSWVAIGASVAIARAVQVYLDDDGGALLRAPRRFVFVPAIALVLFSHLVLDPPLLASRARGNLAMRDIIGRAQAGVPSDPEIERRFVVYVSSAAVPLAAYIPIERAALGVPRPGNQRLLFAGVAALEVERVDERSLRLAPEGGFIADAQSQLLREPEGSFSVGDEVSLPGLTIEVEAVTEDGRPAVVVARFDRPLDDPRYLWLRWGDGGYVPFDPPPVGEGTRLPPVDFTRVVFGRDFDFLRSS